MLGAWGGEREILGGLGGSSRSPPRGAPGRAAAGEAEETGAAVPCRLGALSPPVLWLAGAAGGRPRTCGSGAGRCGAGGQRRGSGTQQLRRGSPWVTLATAAACLEGGGVLAPGEKRGGILGREPGFPTDALPRRWPARRAGAVRCSRSLERAPELGAPSRVCAELGGTSPAVPEQSLACALGSTAGLVELRSRLSLSVTAGIQHHLPQI